MKRALAVLALAAASFADPDPKDAGKPFSERTGQLVTIRPDGPSFAIPESWVEWQVDSGNALHQTRKELAEVSEGAGEWDTEYAEVVNAVLKFDDCGFAGGGEGWGTKSVSYADLQMRTYVIKGSDAGSVEKAMDGAGAKQVAEIMSAARVAKRNGEDPPADAKPGDPKDWQPKHEKDGDWRKSVFAFELRYGDYGATAHVDFRVRQHGKSVLVMVFMYTDFQDQEPVIGKILDSVTWPEAK